MTTEESKMKTVDKCRALDRPANASICSNQKSAAQGERIDYFASISLIIRLRFSALISTAIIASSMPSNSMDR